MPAACSNTLPVREHSQSFTAADIFLSLPKYASDIMTFDRTKAMRDAERYLSQGKIPLAIAEYKQITVNDPKDFGTLNLLGDLYVNNREIQNAISCYTKVAEHYSKQGFAAKAIAVYKKTAKLQPNSPDVAERLAELYKEKGSFTEARSHYVTLAESYQQQGRAIEALAIWKQIALLDPSNTKVYLTIAEAYEAEGQTDEAAEGYVNAAERWIEHSRPAEAANAFEKALKLMPTYLGALKGFIELCCSEGNFADAGATIEKARAAEPQNTEIEGLAVDLLLREGRLAEAEAAAVALAEREPSSFSRFLTLCERYIERAEPASAVRVLEMAADHMLITEQGNELKSLLDPILELEPDNLTALRLESRFWTWQKDEGALLASLRKLSETARLQGENADERSALLQITMLVPHEEEGKARLRQLNEELGYDEEEEPESLFDARFINRAGAETESAIVGMERENGFAAIGNTNLSANGSFEANGASEPALEFSNGATADVLPAGDVFVEDSSEFDFEELSSEIASPGSATGDADLDKEIESIRFYIESGYVEIAEKAIQELEEKTGPSAVLKELRSLAAKAPEAAGTEEEGGQKFDLNDFRSELGLEDISEEKDSDFETHYHTAVAYQEMGLLEEAIREFQEAVNLVRSDDKQRRFFQCANLLGHCFMQLGKPQLAVKWHLRSLETPGLADDEKQGIWYELASAYELDGDVEAAAKYFELVYAENVDFRDVSSRLKRLAVAV
jgi:tetratricopeptide (TPR) repeat protein